MAKYTTYKDHFNVNEVTVNLINGVLTSPLHSFQHSASEKYGGYVSYPLTREGRVLTVKNHINRMKLRFIHKDNIDLFGSNMADSYKTKSTDVTLELPFVYPMFLGDAIRKGIAIDQANGKDSDFFEKTYANTQSLFEALNTDAYIIFVGRSQLNSDINKESVGMINSNMQFCITTPAMLHDYYHASNSMYNHGNPIGNYNNSSTNKFSLINGDDARLWPNDFRGKEFSDVVLDSQLDNLLYRGYSPRQNKIVSLEACRYCHHEDVFSNERDGSLLYGRTKGTKVLYTNLCVNSSVESSKEFIYCSYVATINVDISNFLCGYATYFKLINNSYYDYYNTIQEFQVSLRISSTSWYGITTTPSIKYFKMVELNNHPVFNYSVPMIAKFQVSYINNDIKLSLVDAAALNQVITNTVDTSGSYYDDGNLADRIFTKAPFFIQDVAYKTTNKSLPDMNRDVIYSGKELKFTNATSYYQNKYSKESTILLPLMQKHATSSIIDNDKNLYITAGYVDSGLQLDHAVTCPHSIDAAYTQQANGNIVYLNFQNMVLEFEKAAPINKILLTNVSTLSSIKLINHNAKYYCILFFGNRGVIYEITYDVSANVMTSNIVFNKGNIKSLTALGIKAGEME